MTISITHAFNSPVADGTTLYTGNITSGSAAITGVSPTPPSGTTAVGYKVYGTGIPAGTTILSVAGTTINLSANATATTTGLSFYTGDNQVQPSDWNAQHTLTLAAGKLLGRDTSGAGAVQELPIAVDTSGNVGIGTTSPGAAIDVVRNTGSANSQISIRNLSTATNSNALLSVFSNNNTVAVNLLSDGLGTVFGSAGGVLYTSTNHPLLFAINSAERMRIDSSGNVGIGTTSPGTGTNIGRLSIQADQNIGLSFYRPSNNPAKIAFLDNTGNSGIGTSGAGNLVFYCDSATERARIDAFGQFGLGTTSPTAKLDVRGTSIVLNNPAGTANDNAGFLTTTFSSGTPYWSYLTYNASHIEWQTYNTERMRIDVNGNLGIGTSAPGARLHVTGGEIRIDGANNYYSIWNGSNGRYGYIQGTPSSFIINAEASSSNYLALCTNGVTRMAFDGSGGSTVNATSSHNAQIIAYFGQNVGSMLTATGSAGGVMCQSASSSHAAFMTFHRPGIYAAYLGIDTDNWFAVGGWSAGAGLANFKASAISKASGSFTIEHPLPSMSETHNLVHSFIEGPQADLIYRGKVALVNGRAEVNIDTAAGMTDGTFVLLCRDVQCFTTNETGWFHVRGSVSGNVLTIEAQDTTCTDTISWMVIGERQDKHMYDTPWTDHEGKVIVEPLKSSSAAVSQVPVV